MLVESRGIKATDWKQQTRNKVPQLSDDWLVVISSSRQIFNQTTSLGSCFKHRRRIQSLPWWDGHLERKAQSAVDGLDENLGEHLFWQTWSSCFLVAKIYPPPQLDFIRCKHNDVWQQSSQMKNGSLWPGQYFSLVHQNRIYLGLVVSWWNPIQFEKYSAKQNQFILHLGPVELPVKKCLSSLWGLSRITTEVVQGVQMVLVVQVGATKKVLIKKILQ